MIRDVDSSGKSAEAIISVEQGIERSVYDHVAKVITSSTKNGRIGPDLLKHYKL